MFILFNDCFVFVFCFLCVGHTNTKHKHKQMLQDELTMCEEVLDIEPNSKWALLTSAVLIRALDARESPVKEQKKRCDEIFEKLIKLDTDRKNYYLDVKDALLTQFN